MKKTRKRLSTSKPYIPRAAGDGFSLLKRALLALFVFTLPLLLYTGNDDYNVIKVSFSLIFIVLLLVIWSVEMVRKRAYPLNTMGLLLPFVGVLAAMALSSINSENLLLSAESAVLFACFFMFAVFVANAVQGRRDAYLALGSLMLAAVVAAGYGLLQYYGAVPGGEVGHGANVILSTMGNKNYLGGFLAYLVIPAVGLLLLAKGKGIKALALLCVGVGVSALLAVESESAWLALAGATACWVVTIFACKLTRPFRENRLWLLGLLGVALAAILLQAAPMQWNSLAAYSQADEAAPASTTFPLLGDWSGGDQLEAGLYDPAEGSFQMGERDETRLGALAQGGIPVAGDWLGTGRYGVGVYGEGLFLLDVDLDGAMDLSLPRGLPQDLPVAGDWDGDGLTDLGLYRPSVHTFLLYPSFAKEGQPLAIQAADVAPGDWPIAGDWDGDGVATLGWYRPGAGAFHLDWDNDGRADQLIRFQGSQAEDLPLAGGSAMGLYRPSSKTFFWDDDRDGRADRTLRFGERSWSDRLFGLLLQPSARIRWQNWLIGWEMVRQHPWVGIGLANFKLEYVPYKAKLLASAWGKRFESSLEGEPEVGSIPRASHPHNELVQVAAEMGIAGVLALGFALLCLLRLGRRIQGRVAAPRRFLALCALAGVVAFLLDGMFSFPLYLPASALALAVLVGVLGSRYVQGERFAVRLNGPQVWALTLGFVVSALVVAPLAARDFAADLKLQEGLRLLSDNKLALGESRLLESAALDFQPQAVLLFLGFYYEATGRYEACVRAQEQSLRAYVHEQTYWYLGKCHLALRQYDEAFSYFLRLAAVDPAKALKQKLSDALNELYDQALKQWDAGARDEAVRWLDELAAIASAGNLNWAKLPEVQGRRARWRIESGRWGGRDEGVSILQAWVTQAPDDVQALVQLALTVREERGLKKAVERVMRELMVADYGLQRQELSQAERDKLQAQRQQLAQWQAQLEGAGD